MLGKKGAPRSEPSRSVRGNFVTCTLLCLPLITFVPAFATCLFVLVFPLRVGAIAGLLVFAFTIYRATRVRIDVTETHVYVVNHFATHRLVRPIRRRGSKSLWSAVQGADTLCLGDDTSRRRVAVFAALQNQDKVLEMLEASAALKARPSKSPKRRRR